MGMKRYVLITLLLLPALLSAQIIDTNRVSRPLRSKPAQTVATASQRAPLTNQEKSQIINAVGGGSHPGVMIRTIDNRYEGLQGTPYFLSGWSKGQIAMVSGQRYVDVPIKFDAFRQALILLRPKMGNDSIIIDQRTVSRFELTGPEGQSYAFKNYLDVKLPDNTGDGGYFLVLYEGSITLLKRIAKTVQKANYKQPYSVDIRYDSYENNHAYYILKPNQPLAKVKLSKKSLLDALSDKRGGLSAFADTLNLKTETDAVALVRQYDSLQ